jgi:hypothetical protein
MFSDHLRKDIDELPRVNLALVAAILVVICQLAAMAFVAGGQVQKADQRDLQRLAREAAFAECVERNSGPVRHGCIQQVQAMLDASRGSGVASADVEAGKAPALTTVGLDDGAPRAISVRLANRD